MKTTLYIDRNPVASNASAYGKGTIGVLSGIRIESGRSNPLDHPATATLFATLIAPTEKAARAWLETINVGTRIDIKSNLTLDSQPVKRLQVRPELFSSSNSEILGNVVTVNGSPATFFLAPVSWETYPLNPNAWATGNPRLTKNSLLRIELTLSLPKNAVPPAVKLVATSGPWNNAVQGAVDVPFNIENRGSVKVYRFAGNLNLPADGHPALQVKVQPTRWEDISSSNQWYSRPETWIASGTAKIEGAFAVSHLNAVTRDIPVYSGFIDSWKAKNEGDSTLIEITAVDVLAVLERRMIGAPPRETEKVSERINWVLEVANLPLSVTSSATLDPALSRIDVDARSAWDIIRETANSAALTVWPYLHGDGTTGLFLDDADARPAGDKLIIDPDGTARLYQLASTRLPASIVKNQPVSIVQDSTTVASQALVSYLFPIVDDKGLPDTQEKSVITGHPGSAILRIDTSLTNESDAIAVGDAWLRRTPKSGWKISGISFNSKDAPKNLTGALLNLNTRSACPITLSDLPEWIPAGTSERFIVEGVSMLFDNEEWDFSLTLNRPAKAGKSLKWQELPTGLTFVKSQLAWSDTAGLTL